MNEQEDNSVYSSNRPTADVPHSGQDYWKLHNQPWRTEPEIDEDRQAFLISRCLKIADIHRGEYPFKGVQLSRADIEWLLATPKSERELLDWNIEYPYECKGLDLRGSDLRKINLKELPLSGICGGLTIEEWLTTTQEERNMAKINFEEAILYKAHLEGAVLGGVNLKKANLYKAHLEGATLIEANLEEATLISAHIEGANLNSANLRYARLRGTHLEGADLTKAHLEGTDLSGAVLCGKHVFEDELNQVRLFVDDFPQILPPTKMQGAHLSKNTNLENIILGDDKYGGASLVDVDWEGVNLTVVDWTHIKKLGDESEAMKLTTMKGSIKGQGERLNEYTLAVRANRQLAVVLRNQGLNDEGDHFAYRAQINKRYVLFLQVLEALGKLTNLRWLTQKSHGEKEFTQILLFALLFLLVGTSLSIAQLIIPEWIILFGFVPRLLIILSGIIFILYVLAYKPFIRIFVNFLLIGIFYLLILLLILLLFFFIVTQPLLLFLIISIISIIVLLGTITTIPEPKRERFFPMAVIRLSKYLWGMNIKNLINHIYLPFISIQLDYGRYIFSLFLDLLSGYGYKPGRSLFWYLIAVFGFAICYSTFVHLPLFPDAFVFSLTSFHGRGFFPSLGIEISLHNPLVVLAATEAVIGLFIEISFIATFTRRFFGS